MKKIFILIVFLNISLCFAKKEHLINVPRPDSSPYDFKISHMFTCDTNLLSIDGDVLEITTNNGKIIKGKFYYGKFAIIPKNNGKVIITAKIIKWNKKKHTHDTIITSSNFTAISKPKFKTILNEKLLKDSLTIKYDVLHENNKPILAKSRYSLIPSLQPILIYSDTLLVHSIEFYDDSDYKEFLNLGNIIFIPTGIIRDDKTDLYIDIPDIKFKYK